MIAVALSKKLSLSFWPKVLVVGSIYLLVQLGVLLTAFPGWLKYGVLQPPETFQYWDAGIYAQLAIAPACTAFYPLWPTLIQAVGHPTTLTQALQWSIWGSEGLFLASLPLALLTFEKIIQHQRLAFLTLFLYALGPNAIFSGIGYTEGLFSLLSFALLFAITQVEDQSPALTVKTGMWCSLMFALSVLLSLTRPMVLQSLGAIAWAVGITVSLAVARRAMRPDRPRPTALIAPSVGLMAGIMAAGNIVGYSLYGGYCWQTVGSFWAPFQAQVEWGRSLALRPSLLLLPRSLLIDLHGLYLPALLLVAIVWLLAGTLQRRSVLPLVLPQSPWCYLLLVHPLVFTTTLLGLHRYARQLTQVIKIPQQPHWPRYLGRFSVSYAIAFAGAHACINLLANSGNLYSTSRHVFGTPFVFIGIGVVLRALSVPILTRITWVIAVIGVGLLAQQWVSYGTGGWLG